MFNYRALYKKEHAAENNLQNNAARASSGMNSHRSLPDQERSHVRHSKPIYERNSNTEGGRQKKKSKATKETGGGNNRPKILPILISKQRK
jgi:hypothetical protein